MSIPNPYELKFNTSYFIFQYIISHTNIFRIMPNNCFPPKCHIFSHITSNFINWKLIRVILSVSTVKMLISDAQMGYN